MKQQIVKKAYTKNYRGEGVPTVVDIDTLSYMNDEELKRLYTHSQNEKDHGTHNDLILAWEVEVCYVQRELQIRADRRHAHEMFLRSNPDSAFDYQDFSSTSNYFN